jgi:hypothetical protein
LDAISCPNSAQCIATGTNLNALPLVLGTSNNGASWATPLQRRRPDGHLLFNPA